MTNLDGGIGAAAFLSGLRFRWPWRPYQARVLDSVAAHLEDDRLHVVAAPGSGKTVLGLEVFRCLGRPALVLSPTRAIRDQWVERLRDFVPAGGAPGNWTSTDLEQPRLLTSITYQALHSRYRGENGAEDGDGDGELDEAPDRAEVNALVSLLRSAGIGTLILDEAHHLRAEWWRALTRVLEAIPALKLVSLTATPPYDSAGHEWHKYQALCGSIDEEIAVPELVRSGTLCPHQDFVWTVAPHRDEARRAREYDAAVDAVCARLFEDPVFAQAVQGHTWLRSESDPLAALDSPESATALLVFLHARGLPMSRPLLDALDLRPRDLPRLSRRWWQVLVKDHLYAKHWPQSEALKAHRKALSRDLRAHDLLWRRELHLEASRPVRTALTLSAAKIRSCLEIHRLESALRGADLRQVILTDHIRDDGHDQPGPIEGAPLGAWPVFHALARTVRPERRPALALLTGRLALIHRLTLPELERAAGSRPVTATAHPVLTEYVMVGGAANLDGFTRLLQAGRLRTVVGTRALLGEGWDAPCVNSVILASFVGSYVLTNQMRGRAIRVDRQAPGKVASIWHIVAVDPATPAGLEDLRDLERRFKTFVGVSEREPLIENGLARLKLPFLALGEGLVNLLGMRYSNRVMVQRLKRLEAQPRRWREAIDEGHAGRVVPTLREAKPPSWRGYHLTRTFGYFLSEVALGFLALVAEVIWRAPKPHTAKGWVLLLLAAAVAAGLYLLPKLLRSAIIAFRHLPVDGSVHQMAEALRDALCQTGVFPQPPGALAVVTQARADGSVDVHLRGGTFHQQSVFADALDELLGPIDNPRYLITRSGRRWLLRRHDFHPVPSLVAKNKETAAVFHRAWRRRVGAGELLFTRAPGGRRLLLKARGRAFATALSERPERLDRWQ